MTSHRASQTSHARTLKVCRSNLLCLCQKHTHYEMATRTEKYGTCRTRHHHLTGNSPAAKGFKELSLNLKQVPWYEMESFHHRFHITFTETTSKAQEDQEARAPPQDVSSVRAHRPLHHLTEGIGAWNPQLQLLFRHGYEQTPYLPWSW